MTLTNCPHRTLPKCFLMSEVECQKNCKQKAVFQFVGKVTGGSRGNRGATARSRLFWLIPPHRMLPTSVHKCPQLEMLPYDSSGVLRSGWVGATLFRQRTRTSRSHDMLTRPVTKQVGDNAHSEVSKIRRFRVAMRFKTIINKINSK